MSALDSITPDRRARRAARAGTDLGLEIFFRLREGRVTSGLTAPEAPAEVQLRMKADVLDRMFTGRVNAMQSAMDGKLSFTGDTAKGHGFVPDG